jgi:hypothetical protein
MGLNLSPRRGRTRATSRETPAFTENALYKWHFATPGTALSSTSA